MRFRPQNLSILLITQDAITQADLRKELAESVARVITTDNLTAAIDFLAGELVSLVVCPWSLLEGNEQLDSLVALTTKRLVPVVFYSERQSAAVRFHQVHGQSFYCLKTSACVELVPVIHNLASRLCQRKGRPAQIVRTPIGLPIESIAEVPANIHTLY